MKLNQEQIIKALECCYVDDDCYPCPYGSIGAGCRDEMCSDAFALIRQYEQKIFELENRLKECENGYEGTLALERAKVKELTEENERLKAENDKLREAYLVYEETTGLAQVRADTVREITKRFTEVLKLSLAADNEAFVPVSAVARALAIASAGEEFGG